MPYSKNKICVALLSVITASSVQAQGMLEEVIVTAEKREARLLDTAIAVTVLDAGMLERSNIEDSLDLQFAVPNLMVSGQNNGNFTLRGVGVGSLGGGADASVGRAFNDIPINPAGEVYDLARIEVLRGPQGTLFGRNTTGGVVNVISAKPTGILGGDLTLQLANYDSVRTKGALNLPITDAVSQRFAFNTVKRDGYTDNIFLDEQVDGRDEFSVRSTTRFEFGDTADATLTLQYFEEDSDRQSSVKTACKPDVAIGCAVDTGQTIGYPSDFPTGIDAALIRRGVLRENRYADNPNPDDYRKVSIDTNPEFNVEESFIAFEVNFSLSDDLTFTSQTGYLDQDFEQFRDWDLAAAPNAFYNTPGDITSGLGGTLEYFYDGQLQARTDFSPVQRNTSESTRFSQEFRLASDFGDDFNFLVGISYNKSDSDFLGITYVPSIHAPSIPVLGVAVDGGGFNTQSITESESQAIFGEIYYDLSNDLTLTVGLRYTEDERTAEQGGNPVGPVASYDEAEGEWEEFTGKINLNWDVGFSFADESFLYATLSRGYKGGGLNPGNEISDTFDPEFVNALEFGSKNRLLGNRAQLNLAAFYYDYNDYQVGGLVDGVATNFNADSVRVQGLEIESTYLVTERLMVNANFSLLDTEILKSEPLVNVSLGTTSSLEDVEGNSLPNAPEMSFNIGAQYTLPVTNELDLRFRVDTYWQDEFQGREFDNFTYESWGRTDVFVSLLENQGNWEIKGFVKNISDDEGVTAGVAESNLAGLFRKLTLLDPKTYGLELTYRWQ
jgi:outer membrane receptor protein involved in Fe transport